MSSSGDNFIFQSANSSSNKFAGSYNDKQWFYQVDNQNGVYTNQVTFSLNSFFSESEKMAALSEGFCALPMVSVVHKTLGTTAYIKRNDFAVGLKNSFAHMLNSFTLDIDGKSKVQQSNFVNIPITFRQVTSMSLEEMRTNPVGFMLDTSDSWHYNGGARGPVSGNRTALNPYSVVDSECGNGVVNNVITESLEALTASASSSRYNTGSKSNAGLLKRIKENNFSTSISNAPNGIWTSNAGSLRSVSSIQNELKSYTTVVENGNDNDYQAFYFVAIIKLRDLTDIFSVDAMSLMKAININLTLNLNVGNFQLTQSGEVAANDVFRTYLDGSAKSSFNYTCPLIACPQTYPIFGAAGTASTITYGLYVQNVSNIGFGNQASLNVPRHVMPQCRLYIPLVSLKPSLASLYLQNNQAKLIKYTDIFSTQLLNTQAGGIINMTVSQGLTNARSMLVFPVISGSQNGIVPTFAGTGTLLAHPFSPLISPFSTEPATTSPLIQLSDFGVSTGGREIIQTKLNYGFEQFIEQFYPVNKVNGGEGRPVFNGLLNKYDWENMYRYYFVDLSRGSNEDDQTPRDIRLTCRNDNLVAIDLYIFVLQTKQFVVNCSTGKISDNITTTASLE